jgi:competence protein ComEA
MTMAEDAIVADAIKAAGGFRPGADSDAVNLAASLSDGQQVIVPGPSGAVAGPTATGDGKIAINRATAAELDALPGVGPVLAERIVAHRDQHGPFATVEDLLQVSGIGEAKLASIRDLVSVP